MRRALLIVLLITAAAACIAVPAYQLLVNGPFSWHVEQPQYWQGGIEALLLIAALAALQTLRQPLARNVIAALLAALYLRRHGVDLPALVDVVYLEVVVGLGAGPLRLLARRLPTSIEDYLICFVLGFCVWSACAWTASALDFGTPRDLRWLTLLLCVPAFAARAQPLTWYAFTRIAALPVGTRACAAALGGWFLVLFARSSVVFSYDGLWYGLREQYVLTGAGSVFAPQGLVASAHYVPKLYDLFLVPLSGFGSSSVLIGMTLLMAGLAAIALYDLLGRFGVRETGVRLAIVATCLTLPAIANTALEPKPDMLGALLLMFAWIKAMRFIAHGDRAALLWVIALAMLATQVKLTTIPYAGALVTAMLLARRSRSGHNVDQSAMELPLAWLALALSLCACLFSMARTWQLAGLPTIGPAPLLKLWQALGFELKFPAGPLKEQFPQDWSGLPTLLLDELFRPQRLTHIIITWIGNVWLWLFIAAWLLRTVVRLPRRMPDTTTWPGVGMVLAGAALLVCWGFHERGGDGNYFIAALMPAIMLAAASAWRGAQAARMSRALCAAALIGFCAFQAAYSFASAAWTTGTHPMDFNLHRSVRNLRHSQRAMLTYSGIAGIADWLHTHHVLRAVGYVDDEPAFRLPASYEGLLDISYYRPELLSDRALLLAYLADYRIDALIMPHERKTPATQHIAPLIDSLTHDWATDERVHIVHDVNYDLYDLSGLPGHHNQRN